MIRGNCKRITYSEFAGRNSNIGFMGTYIEARILHAPYEFYGFLLVPKKGYWMTRFCVKMLENNILYFAQ